MMLRVRGATAVVIAALVMVAGCVAACGPSPSPSPTAVLFEGVAVGSVVPCDGATMRQHCDAWIAAARGQANIAAADISTATVHVGWSTVPRTTSVRVVIEFRLVDGTTVDEPIFCGVGADPTHVCDFSGVSLPPK